MDLASGAETPPRRAAGLHSLSHYLDENPSSLSRGDAFTQALAQTALVATPGRDLTPDELRAADRRIRLRRLGVESQTAADRAAHHIPEARLLQAERAVEARMQSNYPGSTSDVDCIRTQGWRVVCHVDQTDAYGHPSSSFDVPGRYVPRRRAVDFRPW